LNGHSTGIPVNWHTGQLAIPVNWHTIQLASYSNGQQDIVVTTNFLYATFPDTV